MKKLFLSLLGVAVSIFAISQDPISWTFTAKKVGDKTYEVCISAVIQNPWSIYSQNTPDGGPLPTNVIFNKHPLITKVGNLQEVGTLRSKHEEVFDVDVLYYKNKVEFVQRLKLRTAATTNVNGTVEFMACNDEQCLPPRTIPFTILLN